jgi:hypothetical protein
MKSWQKLVAVVAVMLLAACQTSRGRHEGTWPPESQEPVSRPLPGTAPSGRPTPVITPGDAGMAPLPERRALPNYPKAADEISGGAVLALLRQARDARAASQYDQAAGVLERALRIEPRNYFVWATLADTYLQQKNFEQAESVAQKSNSLGRGNVYIEQENWRVIRDARNARGNAAGAAEAQARIDAIQQLLATPQ